MTRVYSNHMLTGISNSRLVYLALILASAVVLCTMDHGVTTGAAGHSHTLPSGCAVDQCATLLEQPLMYKSTAGLFLLLIIPLGFRNNHRIIPVVPGPRVGPRHSPPRLYACAKLYQLHAAYLI
jgi:hypothetical protein